MLARKTEAVTVDFSGGAWRHVVGHLDLKSGLVDLGLIDLVVALVL